VDRREREQLLREGGVRDPNEVERRGASWLAEDLEGSPLRGQPTRRRLRNFRPSVEGYVASQGGPLPYMQRLREIESATAGHRRGLEEASRKLATECAGDRAEFEKRWRALAERWNFSEVNDLIERHNRWYPVEARLSMDPRTGDYVPVAGRSYRRRPLDVAWILERFPSVLRDAA
jgi:hypothetical protein